MDNARNVSPTPPFGRCITSLLLRLASPPARPPPPATILLTATATPTAVPSPLNLCLPPPTIKVAFCFPPPRPHTLQMRAYTMYTLVDEVAEGLNLTGGGGGGTKGKKGETG